MCVCVCLHLAIPLAHDVNRRAYQLLIFFCLTWLLMERLDVCVLIRAWPERFCSLTQWNLRFFVIPSPKFNSSPLKSYRIPIGKASLVFQSHPFFRGKLAVKLREGGVYISSGWWFQRFLIFTPIWGKISTHFDLRIFFRWVGEKPPTSHGCRMEWLR